VTRTKRTFLAAALAFACCGAAAAAAPLDASAFAYAAGAPAAAAQSTKTSGGVVWTIVTFRSDGRTVTAEIAAPEHATSPGPGVLFVHWLGDAKTTNHTEFEADAASLAKRGATCVLVDAMWSTVTTAGTDWFDKVRSPVSDYAASIAQVIDLRRALDLLLAQPNVDPSRIAYVGHDFGAMYGAVLAGVDPRPSYYVLMAGTTTFAQWYLLGARPSDVAAYVMQMSALDPLPYLNRSKARAFMFQFAAHDRYVSDQHADAFVDAAPLPRAFFLYDTDHALAVPDAHADRLAWLGARLFP
jgi:dienelactone hydrolase